MAAAPLTAPEEGSSWVALSIEPLPIDVAARWVTTPSCGAVVTFAGTARDHAPGRPGVERLEYEAYEEHAVPRLHAIVEEARRRWPPIGRVAVLHRTGVVDLGDAAVVVAVAAPHRPEAFEAARFVIDDLKQSVPIWKRETWDGGESWGLDAHHLVDAGGSGAAP